MSLHDDYRAIFEAAAIGEVMPRTQLAVAGADRATYLQGLLTNDIPALTPGTGCYAAWLTPQGRMLTDMHVLQSGGMILLDVPTDTAGRTLDRLDQFLFSEDVQLGSLADALTGVWLHGPQAAAVLERVLDGAEGLALWPDYHHAQFELRGALAGAPVSVARIDQLAVPGYCVYLSPARHDGFIAALHAAGARSVTAEALLAARVEAGYPVFGIDMTETTIPLEAGIEQRAISLTKGCYVSQEIIIRVLHRGGGRVAKKLVALRVAGDRPQHGAQVFAGERAIGEITSAAESPNLGAIALAYVHRDFTAPDTQVAVETAAGRAAATVSPVPMR